MGRRRKLRLLYRLYVPHLKWCEKCNLPILFKDRCGLCEGITREVKLTPPGDVRPALSGDLERIRSLCSEFFGDNACRSLFPDNKLVLLNKIGGRDRSEEIIVDGVRMGLIVYEPSKLRWRFKPSLEAGRRLALLKASNWVMIDEDAAVEVAKGRNLMAPGILEMDQGVKMGDEVYIIDRSGLAVAVGIARVAAENIPERGLAVKVRESGPPSPPRILPGGQSWEDAVKANLDVIRSFEMRAIGFIRQNVRDLPAALSFSGGKDSMALLLLSIKALGKENLKVIFIDTGIEYPETLEYVRRVAERYGVSLYVYSAGDGFWRGVEVFGPPARDYRWCCKVCKMAPTKRAINELFGGSTDVLIGLRRVESGDRMRRGSIWRSRWVLGERGVSAIHDWPTLLVWLYLFREGAPVNPLYEMGFDRIGCWLCPSADIADFEATARIHPELWAKWKEILESWAERLGVAEEWARLGGWRIAGRDPRRGSPRISGTELVVYAEDLRFDDVLNILNAAGSPRKRDGTIEVEKDGETILVAWKDGLIRVRGSTDKNTMRVAKTVGRLLFCVGCHLCEYSCPLKAVRIIGGKPVIDPRRCTHCTICSQVCPIYIYMAPGRYIKPVLQSKATTTPS